MKVYKYQGIEKYHFKTLSRNEIYVPTLNQLNDSREGAIDINALKLDINNEVRKTMIQLNPELKILYELAEKTLNTPSVFMKDIQERNKCKLIIQQVDELLFNQLKSQIDIVIENSGIYSLTNTASNELMWAHYANGSQGFVIEYDSEILAPNKKLEEVEYTTETKKIYFNDFIKKEEELIFTDTQVLTNHLLAKYEKFLTQILTRKSSSWSYENEIRLIFRSGELNNRFFSYNQSAVTAIYFGSKMNKHHKRYLRCIFKDTHVKFYQIKDDSHNFQLEMIEVQ
ncbi:DUF2971 domain-containing protein [Wohlfahrtiimonas chitiniclastica]|uniref:DUF2971 domain-containing protein n=1 Tax=Wohlfahrtiimonas chitiniclastica TaxID=400946 RepID=UPI00164C2928|nr:DUF2971 domain-containing protein [Wohlfahrtiimonas chitiniclastica]